jgi:tetratricopeptide (TPR) repeat protein
MGFVVAALYMILPAILVALANVAWTPLAERYIYFSTALCVIGLASIVPLRLKGKSFPIIAIIALIVWMAAAISSTVQRNILWQDKEAFYARAIEMSPTFNKLRNEYGIALLIKGKESEALKQFSLGGTGHFSANAVLNEARMIADDGRLVQALTILTERYPDVHKMNERALRLYAVIRAKMLRDKDFIEDKDALYRDVQDTYALIFKKTKDPLYLYRSGQIALSMKNFGEAQQLFQEAFDKSPEDAYYKKAAGKLARKMEAERE